MSSFVAEALSGIATFHDVGNHSSQSYFEYNSIFIDQRFSTSLGEFLGKLRLP